MTRRSVEDYMRLALKEAKKGQGRTSPNPCVGAVIVKNQEVISTGYHRKAGTPHAEINALVAAGSRAVGGDMYVTLEPCNHYGRTPPCSHAVAAAGIKKVVVGMRDPNPLVDGSGVDYLRKKGIEVECGVLEDESRALNRPFLKYITSSRPWVIMKSGLSLDGKLNYQPGSGGAITGPESVRKVHRIRDSVDAILVGIGTVKADNPALTTRLGRGRGKDPLRVILDSRLEIDEQARVLNLVSDASTWIFCLDTVDHEKVARLRYHGIHVFPVEADNNRRVDPTEVLKTIAEHEMTSVLIEGGSAIHGTFLNRHLVDHACLFYAPVFAGDGGVSLISGVRVENGKRSAIKLSDVTTRRYGNDWMVSGDVIYPG